MNGPKVRHLALTGSFEYRRKKDKWIRRKKKGEKEKGGWGWKRSLEEGENSENAKFGRNKYMNV